MKTEFMKVSAFRVVYSSMALLMFSGLAAGAIALLRKGYESHAAVASLMALFVMLMAITGRVPRLSAEGRPRVSPRAQAAGAAPVLGSPADSDYADAL